jgi:hypothetical protein
MKTFREVQYEHVRRVYQSLLRLNSIPLSSYSLDAISKDVLLSTSRRPLSGNYRPAPYESIDLDRLNVELGLVKADVESVHAYFNLLQEYLRNFSFVTDTWRNHALAKMRTLSNDAMELVSSSYIEGFTKPLALAKVVNRDVTTTSVSEQGYIELFNASTINPTYLHSYSDIAIDRIGTHGTATVYGERTHVFNPAGNGCLTMTLTGKSPGDAGFLIKIRTDQQDVSILHLELDEADSGIKLKVEISRDRSEYFQVFEAVVTHSRIDIPLPRGAVRAARISMTMNIPNIVMADRVCYEFKLIRCLFLQEQTMLSCMYQTLPIELEDETAYLSFVTEDEVHGQAAIRYYLSTEANDDGPVGFSEINRNDETTLVNLNAITLDLPLNLGDDYAGRWSVLPEKKFGGRLYNIVSQCSEFSYGDVEIASDCLVAGTGKTLLEEGLKFYRGVNDYLVKSNASSFSRSVDAISHSIVPNNTTGWIERIPILVRVRELLSYEVTPHSGTFLYNVIRCSCPLYGEELRIEKENGEEVIVRVTEIDDSRQTVTLASDRQYTTVVDPSYNHYVSYVTTLRDYKLSEDMDIILDRDTFSLKAENITLLQGQDYVLYENDLSIEMLKTGAFYRFYSQAAIDANRLREILEVPDTTSTVIHEYGDSDLPALTASYSYVERRNLNIPYYETQVYVSVPTRITILPFKRFEIEAGNFHMINSENVSAMTEYMLPAGWSTVTTTQPYPSYFADTDDVNLLTGKASSAGLVIYGAVEKMRAYRDSMRQVSPFVLASLSAEDGSKCFSYSEGKILINFQPEFLDPLILANNAECYGEVLLGKRGEYSDTYETSLYESVPEEFELEIPYSSTTTTRCVYLKIELSAESGAHAIVRRIGMNCFRRLPGGSS